MTNTKPPYTRGANAVHIAIARRLVATGRATEIRQTAGISLREAAAHIGTGASTIANWELGRTRPGGRHATAYITLLRDLQALQGTSRPGEPVPNPMTTGAGT